MKKHELETFLKPFTGDVDFTICVENDKHPPGISHAEYYVDNSGNGHIMLYPGQGLYNFGHPKFAMTDMWECDNPLGYCVYNVEKDPVWDNCIFCGQPHERK